jgi:hypothetical protein
MEPSNSQEEPMHGTREQLDRYLRRDLDPASLAALDAHVATCLPCSMMLAEAGSSAARWERHGVLGRLVRVDERVEERTVVAPFPSRQRVLRERAA